MAERFFKFMIIDSFCVAYDKNKNQRINSSGWLLNQPKLFWVNNVSVYLTFLMQCIKNG